MSKSKKADIKKLKKEWELMDRVIERRKQRRVGMDKDRVKIENI